MRRLLALSAFLLSTSLFAASYTGSGQWKSNKGMSGNYTSTLQVEKRSDGSYLLKSEVHADGVYRARMEFSLHPTDDTFFRVANVGDGYCWAAADHSQEHYHRICHYGMKIKGQEFEETLDITRERIHNMGHKWVSATQTAVTWSGTLTPEQSQSFELLEGVGK